MQKKYLLALLVMGLDYTGGGYSLSHAQELDSYNLGTTVIEAEAYKNQFGDTITEQSYYRTGGDVDVLDRAKLDKYHFSSVEDALKRIPGVMARGPGYRGSEYGYEQTHTILSINGDDRVVILIDGRRIGNSVSGAINNSSSRRSKASVDVNQLVSMNSIERIEVIKGPGASVYGPDAVGGVINIITRKGSKKPQVNLDFSMGSWGKKHTHFNTSGEDSLGKIRYAIAYAKERGGDSKYHDNMSGKDYTYYNTYYNEDSLNVQLDYKLNKEHSLNFAYNYKDAKDGYPLTAPNHKYFNEKDWKRIKDNYFHNNKYGDINNPGYRTLWYLWAVTGAYGDYTKNNVDLTYDFGHDHQMERFLRLYWQTAQYQGSFGGGDKEDAPVPDTPELYEWAKKNMTTRAKKSWLHHEHNSGVEAQWGKKYGMHNILTTWMYDSAGKNSWRRKKNVFDSTTRSTIVGYVQDKMEFSNKWHFTPAIRYTKSSAISRRDEDGKKSEAGSDSTATTGAISTQYAFDPSTSMYFSWMQVYRPLKVGDLDNVTNVVRPNPDDPKKPFTEKVKLEAEKGNAYTIGFRKSFGTMTNASINYAYTDMKNAVARYSIWNKDFGDFKPAYVNATQKKKSINLSLNHKFSDRWALTMGYTRAHDKFRVKGNPRINPNLNLYNALDINSIINSLRPANVYTADLTYGSDKFFASLAALWYTGCNTDAYTAKRFLVFDLNLNYNIHKDMAAYLNIGNLTNEGWETTYTAYLGKGSWPQPGRSFMCGIKYDF